MNSMFSSASALMRLKIIVTIFLLSLPQIIYAECEGLPERLRKELGYLDSETNGYFSACKIWPADRSKTIVALAHYQEGSSFSMPKNSSNGLYDLDILVVKTDNGQILHRLFQKGALSSDGIYLQGIDVDTARYQLAPGSLAFGLRVNHGNPRATIQVLRLYVIHLSTLKQILGKVSMAEIFSEDQTYCDYSSNIQRTLAIANTASHRYADLILQEKSVTNEPFTTKDGCGVKETKSSHRHTLRFDGEIYVIPKELQSNY